MSLSLLSLLQSSQTQKPQWQPVQSKLTQNTPNHLLVQKASQKYGVSEGLLFSLIKHESGWNPKAQNIKTSKEKSYGLGQINLLAHPNVSIQQATDPNFAVDWVANRLSSMIKKYGFYEGVQAYNTPGAIGSQQLIKYADKIIAGSKGYKSQSVEPEANTGWGDQLINKIFKLVSPQEIKPMKFEVGAGMRPEERAKAYQKIREMPELPQTYIKLPFLQKEFALPATTFPQKFVGEMTKWAVELPEKAVITRNEYPYLIKNKTVPEYTGKVYRVPSLFEDAKGMSMAMQEIGYSEEEARWASILMVGGGAIIDVTIIGGLVKIAAWNALKGIAPNLLERIAAWKFIGRPKTLQEASSKIKELAPQFHPDKVGGLASENAMKDINNAYNVLKETGIPTVADFIKLQIGKVARSLVEPETNIFIRTKQGIKLTSLKDILKPNAGLTKELQLPQLPVLKLPGYVPVKPRPAFQMGFVVEEVKPVGKAFPIKKGIIPQIKLSVIEESKLQPFAQEARKVKLYHGTESSVGGKIEKEGLRYGDFLTSNKQEALDYAQIRAKQKGTKPLVREFTFNRNEVEFNLSTNEWQYKGGIKAFEGGKYPTKIYQAINEAWGTNMTRQEIDKLPFNELRDNASMALRGGKTEFDQSLKEVKEIKVGVPKLGEGVKSISGEIAVKTKSILKKTPKAPPPVSPKAPPMRKKLSSIDRITQTLKEVKPLRRQQEKIYTEERGRKKAKALAVGEKTTGEAGFYRELGQLKGKISRVEFESIRNKISQTDIDNVFKQVKDSKLMNFWDGVSARIGLVKVLKGKVPTEGELILLGRVFPKEFIDTVLSKRTLFAKIGEAGYQLANLPRSVMASFDVSAPFRQGLFLISHPKRFFGSFLDMFKAFGSEKSFKAIQETIVRKPTFDLMQESELALTEMNSILMLREERFMSQWAEKIPIVGRIIRASGRAYTGFLNKLRADVFEDLIKGADRLGLQPRSNPDLVKEIANFVNVASGRGSLGSLQPAATFLNSFFFSPRLMVSRLTLLNPVYYITASPFVRKEALKSLFTVMGAGTTILGLSKLAGADVGVDPRSADFGKIIIGKTRIDVWGGFQQYIRMLGQVFSGQYVSSVTGKLVTLGEGYKPLTRLDILQKQVEAKEAPVFSFITALLKGKNFMGEKINIPKEVRQRFIPMAIQDIYDIYKNDPELLPLSGLGMFGFGLQTYSEERGKLPTEKEKKEVYEISKILGGQARQREELSNAVALIDSELQKLPPQEANIRYQQLKKENPEMAEKLKDVIEERKLGLTYTEKMMKQLGVANGERAKYINEQILKLPTREERNAYYQELRLKKVITDEVANQIKKLLNK